MGNMKQDMASIFSKCYWAALVPLVLVLLYASQSGYDLSLFARFISISLSVVFFSLAARAIFTKVAPMRGLGIEKKEHPKLYVFAVLFHFTLSAGFMLGAILV